MNYTQNRKMMYVTEATLVVGGGYWQSVALRESIRLPGN